MQLTQPQIKKFQELYFKQTGKKISRSEAIVAGSSLIELVKAIYPAENMNMKRITNEQATSK